MRDAATSGVMISAQNSTQVGDEAGAHARPTWGAGAAFLLAGRLIFGGYFLYAGLNHFIHMRQLAAIAAPHRVPGVMIPLSGALLVLGALHLLVGVMPRLGLAMLVVFLVPVSLVMHPFWAEADPQRMQDMINFTKNLALIGACFGFAAVPTPWPYSIDATLYRRAGREPRIGSPLPH
jgi:uncharacterized membrane protein YphA (DoxX/SURF4 family)